MQLLIGLLAAAAAADLPPSVRPTEAHRKFRSSAVDAKILQLKSQFKDPAIAILFENCYPNTLDTTVNVATANDSFVITGDITAMWLRDSTNQVLPYMMFAQEDEDLRSMLRGVVMRQVRSVLLDPYANAFNEDPSGGEHQGDPRTPPMTPPVFEGKYELDSLAAVMRLSARYWKATGDASVLGEEWMSAMELILETCQAQTLSSEEQPSPPYTFGRPGEPYPGRAAGHSNMIRSAFRPSDDRTTYDFLVPANLMAAAALKEVSAAAASVQSERGATLSWRTAALAKQLFSAALANGTHNDRYVYEVDGLGKVNDMDDGNVPSLLSLPYLGAVEETDEIYLRTRAWVLSSANPWYFEGRAAKGVGSPHTGKNRIWPMSIIMRALTSTNDEEILECLEYLKAAALEKGFMHEGFDKDDPTQFSRPWFAWANALFGELILKLAEARPHLVLKDFSVIV